MPYYPHLEGSYEQILDRLRSAPARLSSALDEWTSEHLILKPDGKWSAQEHAGHLLCIESLWIARLDDFAGGHATLRPWNGTNSDTDAARFNEQRLRAILRDFVSLREAHVEMLSSFGAQCESMSAYHERFQTPLRLLDHVYMMAEHDDEHLGIIARIKSTFL